MTEREMEVLFKEYKYLVFIQSKKFGLLKDVEAESIGYEALVNAINTYDPTNRASLATYASVVIYNAIGGYYRHITRARQIVCVSYDATLEDGSSYIDVLSRGNTTVDTVLHNELEEKLKQAITEVRASLSCKQSVIITAWIKSNFSAKTTDLASLAKTSQPYVSETIAMFKHKVKINLKESNYELPN